MKKNNTSIVNNSLIGFTVSIIIFFGSLLVFPNLYALYVNTKTFLILIGTSITLLIALFSYPIRYTKKIKNIPVFWALVGYVTAIIITSLTSYDPTLSILGLPARATGSLLLVVLSLLACVIGVTLTNEQVKKYIFYPISLSGVLIVLSIYLERLGWNLLATASDGGLLGNNSYTGAYLLVSFFVTVYLLLHSTGNKKIQYIILHYSQ